MFLKKSVYAKTTGSYVIKKETLTKNKSNERWIANLRVKDSDADAQVHQNVKLSYNGNSNLFLGTISSKYHKAKANYYRIQLEPFKPSLKHSQKIGKLKGTVYFEVKKMTYWNYITENVVTNN